MAEGMNNPERNDHGPTWPLVQSLLVESCKPEVLGGIARCTLEWTEIGEADSSELHSIHDRTRSSWGSGMVDTLVVWEAIGNAGHLGPNYGKKAWLMRVGEQSRLHKALQQSATVVASIVIWFLPSASAGLGHANGVETDTFSY